MAPQPYPVIGLEGTGIHPRLEITDLQTNTKQFSLFIRALNKLLNMQSEYGALPNYVQSPTSWWQIGGIHGLPFEPWAGDPNGPQKPVDPQAAWGYCYHGAALFPTWHRVLLLLVEQAVVRQAIDIASNLPESDTKQEWVQAANDLRFPFWDWSSQLTKKQGILKIFQEPKVSIAELTSSETEDVPNPLNHYRFPQNHKPGPVGPGLGVWSRTLRWANFNQETLTEDYKLAKKSFISGGVGPWENRDIKFESLRRKVAGLFNYPLDEDEYGPNLWGRFSTTGSGNIYVPNTRYETLPSLEDSHNSMHLNIGGLGSMADPDYAGFDPIFYLHHANVDRIYAFWEWLYSKYWIGNKGWRTAYGDFLPFRAGATFTQAGGSEILAQTFLTPFRHQDGGYWSSEQVQSLLSSSQTQKYYTYPKITENGVDVDISTDISDSTLKERERFRQALYKHWTKPLSADVAKLRAAVSINSRLYGVLLEEPANDENSYLRNFVIVGEVPEFAFPGSYRLELYLPASGNDPDYVVDEIAVFGRTNPDKCAACRVRRAAGNKVRGHIHLGPEVFDHLIEQDESLQPSSLDQLVDLIKKKFRLRIAAPDGTGYADTEPHPGTDRRGPLDVDKIPQVTLHSHRVWFNRAAVSRETRTGYVPLGLHDVVDHGDLELESAWKKA